MKWPVLALALLAACAPSPPTPRAALPPRAVNLNLDLPAHAFVTALAAIDGTLVAGVNGSPTLYLSPDDSRSWTAAVRGLEDATVLALGAAGTHLLAGTGAGLFALEANQDSWTRLASVPQVPVFAVARAQDGTVLAASDGAGLYASADGRVFTRLPGLDGEILLAVAALDSANIWVGTSGHGLWFTHDAGAHWQPVAILRETYVSALLLLPPSRNGGEPVLVVRTRNALYRSEDGGTEWAPVRGELAPEVVTALTLIPGTENLLAGTASGGVWRQVDAGHFVQAEGLPRGPAVLAFAWDAVGRVYAGTAEGIWRSEDGGKRFVPVAGLGAPAVHQVARHEGATWAALDDGLYRKRDGESAWGRVGGDRLNLPVLSLVFAPAQSSAPEVSRRVYAGTARRGVMVSDDGGETWAPAEGDLGGRLSIPGLAVDPRDPERVFARVLYQRIYRSTDGGDHWRTQWSGMADSTEVVAMAPDPSRAGVIWAGATDGMFLTETGGEPWLRRGLAGQSVLAILPEPGRVWAGATNGLYASTDEGGAWSPVGLDGMTVTALARGAAGRLLAGTRDSGLWSSADDGGTWDPYGLGLEGESIDSLAVEGARVFVSTPRGIWEIDAP